MQSDNEICSVNTIYHERHVRKKSYTKGRGENSPTTFS